MGSAQNVLPTKNGAVCCKSAPLCFLAKNPARLHSSARGKQEMTSAQNAPRAGGGRAGEMKKRRKALIHWVFDAADGALGGIRTHGLPLRRFFQAEAHGRLLCHAMAKTAIKSGGFRRLYYARHFPLKYRLQRMELPKKIAPISESYF